MNTNIMESRSAFVYESEFVIAFSSSMFVPLEPSYRSLGKSSCVAAYQVKCTPKWQTRFKLESPQALLYDLIKIPNCSPGTKCTKGLRNLTCCWLTMKKSSSPRVAMTLLFTRSLSSSKAAVNTLSTPASAINQPYLQGILVYCNTTMIIFVID